MLMAMQHQHRMGCHEWRTRVFRECESVRVKMQPFVYGAFGFTLIHRAAQRCA